jgi:hypothetical protein
MKNNSYKKLGSFLTITILLFSVTACNASSTNGEVSLEEAKSLVRTLFYDRQQAWNDGAKKGSEFDAANNYPGAYDVNALQKCVEERGWIPDGYAEQVSVDIDSLAPDEKWIGPVDDEEGWLFSGKKPDGQTFIVTITSSSSSIYSPPSEAFNSDVHVTILNGKAYFYFGKC